MAKRQDSDTPQKRSIPTSKLIGKHPWRQLIIGTPLGLAAASVAGITQLIYTSTFQGARTWEEALALPWPSQPLGMALQIIAAVSVMWFITNKIAKRPVYELSCKQAGRELLLGIFIGITVIGATIFTLISLGIYEIIGASFDYSQPADFNTSDTLILGRSLLIGLMFSLGSSIGEEIVMRGILLRIFIEKLGTLPALTITSSIFGFLHLTNPHTSFIGAFSITIQAGLLFGIAYVITRRLWLTIGIHAAWNFTQTTIFGFNVSGIPVESGLLTTTIHGPEWLSGGEMGIEGSIITVGFSIVACGILIFIARNKLKLP